MCIPLSCPPNNIPNDVSKRNLLLVFASLGDFQMIFYISNEILSITQAYHVWVDT